MGLADVFVVDDDPAYRELLATLLDGSRRVAAVHCFGSGLTALRALRSAARLPRVMLLDYHLPVMEAPQVLRAMREQAITGVRVAVLSNDAAPDLLSQCLVEGAAMVLRKPERAEDTLLMLQDTLEKLA